MSTATDLGFLYLILNASFLVQLVMLSLIITSFISWTMIFNKRVMLRKAKKSCRYLRRSVLVTGRSFAAL